MAFHFPFQYLGSDQFAALRQEGQFYVDKSLFIKEVFESAGLVKLILRPRRFGKSLNLDMLRCFLTEKEANTRLFAGLAITSFPELMAERGKHPCIMMTLKGMSSATNWDSMLEAVRRSFADLFQRFFSEIDAVLTPNERDRVVNYMQATASAEELRWTLFLLTELLERVHDKKVWVLIDEYDAPLIQASNFEFLPQALAFFRGLFSNALKTNKHLERAVLTGVTRISKESIVSGLNNVSVYNALSPQFATAFGFTDDETTRMIKEAGLAEKLDEARSWYNGYLFGDTSIYNPWSIAQFLANHIFQAYWSNTGNTTLLMNLLLSPGNDPAKMNFDLDCLLQGKEIVFSYYDNTTFNELESNRETILTFLLQSGYLTVSKILDSTTHTVSAKIPNMEILNDIKSTLFKWVYSAEPQQKTNILKAFTSADYLGIQNILSHFSSHLSYYDIPKSKKPRSQSDLERVYHVFLLGILTALESEYELDSNLETGTGRADLLLRPRNPTIYPGYIIEIKVSDSEENLEKTLKTALHQIIYKDYITRLTKANVVNIHALGICFFKKILLIKGMPLHPFLHQASATRPPELGLVTRVTLPADPVEYSKKELDGALADLEDELQDPSLADEMARIAKLRQELAKLAPELSERALLESRPLLRLKRYLEAAQETGDLMGVPLNSNRELLQIAQALARGYNRLANLAGFPQVSYPQSK